MATDPKELEEKLDKVENMNDLVDVISDWIKVQEDAQDDRSKVSSWVMGLVVSVIALVIAGVFYFRARRQGAELAKLQHEKDVQLQQEETDRMNQAIAQSTEEIDKYKDSANKALENAINLSVEIEKLRIEKEKTDENIKQIRNWRNLRDYMASRKNSAG